MANVCVFCSSAPESLLIKDYVDAAKETGYLLEERGHNLIYGGSHRGLMGVVSKSFAQDNGNSKRITEIIPKIWQRLIINKENAIVTENISERMQKMQEYSDAFITLAGGFGSLQETIEVLVSKQINMHQKPLVIINTNNFYNPLIEQINLIINQGLAPKDNNSLAYIASNPRQALEYIETYKPIELSEKVGA
ncbi:MAG: TIGR00730 family Rossman fold protein [Candidatus Nanoarchaeia archaeon]